MSTKFLFVVLLIDILWMEQLKKSILIYSLTSPSDNQLTILSHRPVCHPRSPRPTPLSPNTDAPRLVQKSHITADPAKSRIADFTSVVTYVWYFAVSRETVVRMLLIHFFNFKFVFIL